MGRAGCGRRRGDHPHGGATQAADRDNKWGEKKGEEGVAGGAWEGMEAAGEDRRIGRALGVRDAGNDVRDDASTHTLTRTAIEVAFTPV